MRHTAKMTEILVQLIDARGSRRSFAKKIGVPPTTLQSMLTKDLGRASFANVFDTCRELGITVDQLEAMASGQSSKGSERDRCLIEDWSEDEIEDLHMFKQMLLRRRSRK